MSHFYNYDNQSAIDNLRNYPISANAVSPQTLELPCKRMASTTWILTVNKIFLYPSHYLSTL